MNRDDHERAIFLQALNLPGGLDDDRHPFDAECFLESFTEKPARIIHAADDPVLNGLAQLAREAWADFLARNEPSEERPGRDGG